MDWIKKNKRNINFFIDPNKAVENADVIFSDKVVSLNDKVNKLKKLNFKNYRINSSLMKKQKKIRLYSCIAFQEESSFRMFFRETV